MDIHLGPFWIHFRSKLLQKIVDASFLETYDLRIYKLTIMPTEQILLTNSLQHLTNQVIPHLFAWHTSRADELVIFDFGGSQDDGKVIYISFCIVRRVDDDPFD